MPNPSSAAGAPAISVVLPVYNEAASIRSVLDELLAVLDDGAGRPFEVIAVDDGSTDATPRLLAAAAAAEPRLRVLTLTPNTGQSAAFGVGFRACRGKVAILMDGDGQNDPRDIPMLLKELEAYDACCGYRALRRDSFAKKLGSRLANALRRLVLQDGIRDTGCSLKAVKTEFLRDLPMQFRGMHRFLPALWLMEHARIKQVPVNHRPRTGGRSKYTNLGRLKETLWDLWAVRWMQTRHRRFRVSDGGQQA